MLSGKKMDGSCFYAPRRDGGKRPNRAAKRRLVNISNAMSGALRRRKLRGMTREEWTPMKTLRTLPALLDLGAGVHDVWDIVDGAGGNN